MTSRNERSSMPSALEESSDSGMGQDVHLGRPLGAVRRLLSGHSAGMAAEFGQSGRQIRQDRDERLD